MQVQPKNYRLIYPTRLRKLAIHTSLAVLFLSVATISPSFGQEDSSRQVIALQNQVAQLKAQVSQLQSQNMYADNSSDKHRKKKHNDDSADSTANSNLLPDLVSRINNLEDQQRVMRGELDDLSNQLKTQTDLINKKIDDMNFAAGHGDTANVDANKAASVGAGASSAAIAASKTGGANNATGNTLKDGQQALLNGDFQKAESIARQLLTTSEGSKSVNAQFLLAQAQAGQGNFKASSVSYYTVFKNFPKSSKAPVALLGVGYSLVKNGKAQEACQALGLLHNKYPNASDQVKKSASKLSQKAKCS